METIYYTLDARRVTCCGMASGEALPRRSYAVLRREVAPRTGERGKVVDFTAYRQAMVAHEDANIMDVHKAPEAAKPMPAGKGSRTVLLLELIATAAVIAMAAAVIFAFLPLLSSV